MRYKKQEAADVPAVYFPEVVHSEDRFSIPENQIQDIDVFRKKDVSMHNEVISKLDQCWDKVNSVKQACGLAITICSTLKSRREAANAVWGNKNLPNDGKVIPLD